MADHSDPLDTAHLIGHVKDSTYFEFPRVLVGGDGKVDIPQLRSLDAPPLFEVKTGVAGLDELIEPVSMHLTKFMVLEVIGGIIVCDFIDMQRSSSRRNVERALRQPEDKDRELRQESEPHGESKPDPPFRFFSLSQLDQEEERQRHPDEHELDEAEPDIGDELERNLRILYKEFPYLNFDKRILYRNQEVIRSALAPTKGLHAYYAGSDAGAMTTRAEKDGDEYVLNGDKKWNTGGAVASAFHRVEGTRVVILYPKGKISGLQEKQLTALGGNITALEVDGTFDDCQRMVKEAFADPRFAAGGRLTSANSINIGR